MSQPHDGQRPSLPFGNPFRMIFPRGSYLSPKLLVLLSSFEQPLAERLKKLRPEDISDIWSLPWLSKAVKFLSETHESIKNLITDLELPVSHWEDKWIDTYLDGSIKLLDICIALSTELSRLDRGRLLLQYALHQLELSSNDRSSEKLERVQTTLSDWMQLVDSRNPKLDDCCLALQGLAGTLYPTKVKKNSAKGKVLMRALHAVKVVTILVCSILTSALCGGSKPLVRLVVADKFLWAGAFNDLQADVFKGIMGQISGEKVIALKELGAVEECVKRLCSMCDSLDREEEEIVEQASNVCDEDSVMVESCNGRKERWRESVSELAEASDRLSVGLDQLSKQVEDFFQMVLHGRDALLCNLAASDDVLMQNIRNR